MAKLDPERGINKREAATYNYYPEEWPEESIFHGARGDIRCRSSDEVGQRSFNQDRSGVRKLVLRRLLTWQEDRFVSGSEVKTTLAIETLGPLIRFVYQQAD
jgi:hypothetical protein